MPVVLACTETGCIFPALLYLLVGIVAAACALTLTVLILGFIVAPIARRLMTRLGLARTDEERWDMEDDPDDAGSRDGW